MMLGSFEHSYPIGIGSPEGKVETNPDEGLNPCGGQLRLGSNGILTDHHLLAVIHVHEG